MQKGQKILREKIFSLTANDLTEKVDKSNTSTQKPLCFFQLEHYQLELPPTSINIISFVLTLGDSITEIPWTASVVSRSKLPNHYFKTTAFKSQFCMLLIAPNIQPHSL